MANVQLQFDRFHEIIRRVDDEDKRNKRDMLVKELRENLPPSRPAFTNFNQGSYGMHTRVVPLQGDDDIDVGLRFVGTADSMGCPVVLKKDIKEALDREGRTVLVRGPCVTVQYIKGGEPDYHVDLAVYARSANGSNHLELARGKIGSPETDRTWDECDPIGQKEAISKAYPNDDEHRAQFRRCIRMLKRWRDERYGMNVGPISVALTCAARRHFSPEFDPFSGEPDDRAALRHWVDRLLGRFVDVADPDVPGAKRIEITNVAFPYADLMARTSLSRHTTFHRKLERLRAALDEADDEPDPVAACRILRGQFGNDFPVPDKSSTAKIVAPPVVQTGNSA